MKNEPIRIFSVGECLVEFIRIGEPKNMFEAGNNYGPFASGAPAIFCDASATLGNRVSFIGGIGNDAFGGLILDTLRKSGVEVSYLKKIKNATTGIAFCSELDENSRDFVFHLKHSASALVQKKDIEFFPFQDYDILHISGSALSIASELTERCNFCLEQSLKHGLKISFDPNFRKDLISPEAFAKVANRYFEACDFLFCSEEELRVITRTQSKPGALQKALSTKEGKIVVLKKGSEGSEAYQGTSHIKSPGFMTQVVDSTGAGDVYGAAFLREYCRSEILERACLYANRAASEYITVKGIMQGVPSDENVLAGI